MKSKNAIPGPYYVAIYVPPHPSPEGNPIREQVASYDLFEDAVINARKLSLGSALKDKHTEKHACVYIEHDDQREIVWASA